MRERDMIGFLDNIIFFDSGICIVILILGVYFKRIMYVIKYVFYILFVVIYVIK